MHNPENISIIGAGTMGHSIALNFAWKGLPVIMYGKDAADLDNGLNGIKAKLALMARENLIRPEEQENIIKRITLTTNFKEAATNATFIIEAAPEILELKHKLFLDLEELCPPETIFASNTSALAPSLISEPLNYPQRFLVTHFWNPAHLVPLVEVVPSAHTSAETIEAGFRLLEALGKKAILVRKEIPGFIANRLQFALFREAQYLLESNAASKEDIDAAVTYSIGRRLPVTGPILSADLGGLDVFDKISDYLYPSLSNAQESSIAVKRLLSEGKYGLKTGEGFYTWNSDLANINERREQMLIRLLRMEGEG